MARVDLDSLHSLLPHSQKNLLLRGLLFDPRRRTMMPSQARSLPQEANDFGIHEVLRRHRDTHLVQRQLVPGVGGPSNFSNGDWSPRSSNGSESQGWVPSISRASESTVATRQSQPFSNSRGTRSYAATSTSEETETDVTSLPGSDVGWEQNQGPIMPEEQVTLPCEFAGYTNCERRFGLDQVQRWLDHVTGFHLQGHLPHETVCWFCDEGRFVTTSNRDVDKEACFRQRMYHIVGHFRDNANSNGLHIRPDFPFLDHLARWRLIRPSVIDQARNYSEMPPEFRVSTDTERPPRRGSERDVVIENNRSGGRRQRREQRYRR